MILTYKNYEIGYIKNNSFNLYGEIKINQYTQNNNLNIFIDGKFINNIKIFDNSKNNLIKFKFIIPKYLMDGCLHKINIKINETYLKYNGSQDIDAIFGVFHKAICQSDFVFLKIFNINRSKLEINVKFKDVVLDKIIVNCKNYTTCLKWFYPIDLILEEKKQIRFQIKNIDINLFEDGLFEGYLDIIADGYVQGWAWSPANNSITLPIDIYIDGNYIDTINANNLRKDLLIENIRSEEHGFLWPIPEKFYDGKKHFIATKIFDNELITPKDILNGIYFPFSLQNLFNSNQLDIVPPEKFIYLKTNHQKFPDLSYFKYQNVFEKKIFFIFISSQEEWKIIHNSLEKFTADTYNVIICVSNLDHVCPVSGNYSFCKNYIAIHLNDKKDYLNVFIHILSSKYLNKYEEICYINFQDNVEIQKKCDIPSFSSQNSNIGVVSSNIIPDIDLIRDEYNNLISLATSRQHQEKVFLQFVTPVPQGPVTWITSLIIKEINALPLYFSDFNNSPSWNLGLLGLIGGMAKNGDLDVLSFQSYLSYNEMQSNIKTNFKVKAIAFYLPQFHPIDENDTWWGKGFTEWNNVIKGRPLFRRHYQPRIPEQLGFYDLRVSEIQETQAKLANESDIYGFCYYYYWFNGRKILEKPIEALYNNKNIFFPYCICWANENWSRNWDGQNKQILIKQEYSLESCRDFIHEIMKYMRDLRYITYQNKPVLLVYRILSIPNWNIVATMWREECRKSGIGEIHLCAVRFGLEPLEGPPSNYNIDSYVLFPPHESVRHDIRKRQLDLKEKFEGEILSYESVIRGDIARFNYGYPWPVHRGIMGGWDNTARRDLSARIFVGASPLRFQSWLKNIIEQEKKYNKDNESLIFINAWNEWGEGTYLEPDQRYGDSYLQALKLVLHKYNEPFSLSEKGKIFAKINKKLELKEDKAYISVNNNFKQKKYYKGNVDKNLNSKTILFCAHVCGHQLFGGERSFIDVAKTLASLKYNLVITLPSYNEKYIEILKEISTGIYVFEYNQWKYKVNIDEMSCIVFQDIIALENITLVYINTIMLREPLIAAKRMNIIRCCHAREIITLDEHLQKMIALPPSKIIEEIFSNTDYIIANSHVTESLFYRKGKVFYAPNMVDIDYSIEIDNKDIEKIKFGIVSSNIPTKGIIDFIEIAKICYQRIPKALFVVVGPINNYIKNIISNLCIPKNIKFVGYRDTPQKAMHELDVLLNLSHFAESFGRTVAEGMANRKPVIAYHWGALPELVEDGVTGYLVDYRNISNVCHYIEYLYNHPKLIKEMGEKGFYKVSKNYSSEILKDKIKIAFDKILGSTSNNLINDSFSNCPFRKTSIIIPVYNAFDEIKECLESVKLYTDFTHAEVILIDDGSEKEKMQSVISKYLIYDWFRYIRNIRNMGYTSSINKAISYASENDVVLLNSDVYVTPNWLEGLRAAAYSTENIGTATAMSDNAGAFSFPVQGIKNYLPDGFSKELFSLKIIQHTSKLMPISVPTGSGFCLFIRNIIFKKIGYFNDILFSRGYGEENDFCMRIGEVGWKNIISPWSYVFHKRNASFKTEKDNLILKSQKILGNKYPQYSIEVKKAFSSFEMIEFRATAQMVYDKI